MYNPGSEAVDLSGYFMTDVLRTRRCGSFRKARRFRRTVTWWCGLTARTDERTGRRAAHEFSFGAGGEAIGLFAAGGVLIDSVTFGAQTNGVAQGRFTDGQSAVYFMTPTPRAPNVVAGTSNNPPSIAVISSKTVTKVRC